MCNSDKNEGEVEIGQVPSKENVSEGEAAHYQGSDGVASLPPDPIDHFRDPRPREDRGESEGTHNNPYICLRAAVARYEKGKEEEGTETGYGEQVGNGHDDE